jgi:hypothetical protein
LQYVELDIVRYAAMILASVEENGLTIRCEHKVGDTICGDPPSTSSPMLRPPVAAART